MNPTIVTLAAIIALTFSPTVNASSFADQLLSPQEISSDVYGITANITDLAEHSTGRDSEVSQSTELQRLKIQKIKSHVRNAGYAAEGIDSTIDGR